MAIVDFTIDFQLNRCGAYPSSFIVYCSECIGILLPITCHSILVEMWIYSFIYTIVITIILILAGESGDIPAPLKLLLVAV